MFGSNTLGNKRIYTLTMRASPPTRNSIERPVLSTSVSGSSVVVRLEITCIIVLNRFLESDSLDHLPVTEHSTRVETSRFFPFLTASWVPTSPFHFGRDCRPLPACRSTSRLPVTWVPVGLVSADPSESLYIWATMFKPSFSSRHSSSGPLILLQDTKLNVNS